MPFIRYTAKKILMITALSNTLAPMVKTYIRAGVIIESVIDCVRWASLLMLSWAVMISLCHADMRLPGYLSWNVSFDGADLSAPSRKELVHTSMLCQHFKRRDDGTGICLFHSAVMPEAFLIPEEICQ